MKILFSIASLNARDGGPPRGVLELGNALARIGEEVTIIGSNSTGHDRMGAENRAADAGVRVRHLTRKNYERFSQRRFKFSAKHTFAMVRLTRSHDIISSHGFYQWNTIQCYMASRFYHKPLVIQPHGVFEPYQQKVNAPAKRTYLWLIGNRILRHASLIVVASDQEVAGVQAITPHRETNIAVCGLGTERFSSADLAPDTGAARVVFLSRLAPKKRADLLIEAIRILDDKGTRIAVDMCGDGEREFVESLKSRARGLPIEFHGHVTGEVKNRLMSSATLFCLPSDNENFGQAITEAMARGLAVLCTDTCGASNHVERAGAGVVMSSPDAASLAEAILRMVSDPASLIAMGKRGRTYAGAELSWSAVAERWRSAVLELSLRTP